MSKDHWQVPLNTGTYFGLVATPIDNRSLNSHSPSEAYNNNKNNNYYCNYQKVNDDATPESKNGLSGKPNSAIPVRFSRYSNAKKGLKQSTQKSDKLRKCLNVSKVLVPLILAVVIIIILIVVPLTLQGSKKKQPTEQSQRRKCSLSQELKDSGLYELIQKVRKSVSKNYPADLVINPASTSEQLWRDYKPFIAKPEQYKQVTDEAEGLLGELEEIRKKIDENKLKGRERKALYEVHHYLKNSFGTAFEGNYYTGDWMLEPNGFCWSPSCLSVPYFSTALSWYLKPENIGHVRRLIEIIKQFRESILQTIANMRMGVRAGMVRPLEACRAGFLAYRSQFSPIAIQKEKGVKDLFIYSGVYEQGFLSMLTPEMHREWLKDNGENITESITRNLEEHIGKPILEVLQYLENEHMKYCPPSTVSSGLALLPLEYVYINGVPDYSQRTTQKLPTGEPLNGTRSFLWIAQSMVAKHVTPEELEKLGREQLQIFYAEAVSIAKQATGESDEAQAIAKFKEIIEDPSNYFNQKPFPANESDDNAFLLCTSDEKAKMYCPKRWEALQDWTKYVRKLQNNIKAQLGQIFYTSGPKVTTPTCDNYIFPDYKPAAAFRAYSASWTANCSAGRAGHVLTFFMDKFGPKFSDYSLAAHEYQPGHHTEVQGFFEHFMDKCGDAIAWLTDQSFFSGFSEGWAMYSEHPLMDEDLKMYEGNLLARYGMIQQMIMASLRLIIEPGLHVRGMTRSAALQLFQKYTWDTSDLSSKEITRYQSTYGQGLTYMVGRNAILQARSKAEQELGKEFSIQDFHYAILHQGDLPLDYLPAHIDHYIKCRKNPSSSECTE